MTITSELLTAAALFILAVLAFLGLYELNNAMRSLYNLISEKFKGRKE